MAMLNNQMVMFTFPYFSEAYIFFVETAVFGRSTYPDGKAHESTLCSSQTL
jgi:hypothetical protein